MHRPFTWLAGIGGTILMLLSACSAGSDRTPSEPPTIKIGVIIPTQGQSASLAASFEKAVRVSVDTLPNTTKHRYQLVVADAGGGTEEESKRAARQLVEEHKVAAIVGGISKVGEHVAPIATAAKVPRHLHLLHPHHRRWSIQLHQHSVWPKTRARPGWRRPRRAACARSPSWPRSTRASAATSTP